MNRYTPIKFTEQMRVIWVSETIIVLFLDYIANMKYIFKSRFNAISLYTLLWLLTFVLIRWLPLYENEEFCQWLIIWIYKLCTGGCWVYAPPFFV